MNKIDNVISIIMVFVTGLGFSMSFSLSAFLSLVVIIASFIIYEMILNAANNNPSIRTVLYVTVGFIFGLSLTMVLDLKIGWLSALICLLCMGYKYLCAEATVRKRSVSKNIFVVVVNAFFYAVMFTVLECMMFGESTLIFIMLYTVSFIFFMCCYIVAKNISISDNMANVYTYSDGRIKSDWKHILVRTRNYSNDLKKQIIGSVDEAVDGIDRYMNVIKHKVMPIDSEDNKAHDEEYASIIQRLNDIKNIIDELRKQENLQANEQELIDEILNKHGALNTIINTNKELNYMQCEADLSEINNLMEMLRNSIRVRKARDKEYEYKSEESRRRSEAQRARRKREREEKERLKREQERAKQEEATKDSAEEEQSNRAKEEEQKRRDEEKRRQEKRRTERNKKASEEKTVKKTMGDDTMYFKGCDTLDELSLRYKKLCLIYHPDSPNGDADTYIELKEEYERLKKRLKL